MKIDTKWRFKSSIPTAVCKISTAGGKHYFSYAEQDKLLIDFIM